MKKQMRGVVAMALMGTLAMGGVAAAAPAATKDRGVANADFSYEVTKTGAVVTHQTVNGVTYSFTWTGSNGSPIVSGGVVAKGFLGTLLDLGIELVKHEIGGGSSGGGGEGGGAGGGHTCTVNITVTGGTQSVNVGNVNCGVQGGGSGTSTSGPA